ncbi:hypothetical protein [Allocoleopsis franciscana]|uniref:Uncharacterized protein n=1 Tax=Allocoleopsis franciscana PCC 7113 TaxID=1173027 RepID=K9WNZ1_9CYAN|nr:hypothetical protein [Allocoleopsis franciscana]AFZ22090.1 hypothetical protein Mic7113_6512 [Allocoleopsis franciscana PCC 7113]
MTENIAFDTPHRPDTTGVRYTLWTEQHDNAAADLTPCAARLYRWMLEQAPGGVSQSVDLADFQSSTASRKRQAGYHIKHILRSFKELVEAGLARVTRWYGNCKRIFNVVVRHSGAIRPIQLSERKNSRKQEKILHGSKKFQLEAETRIPPFSIQSNSKNTTDTHPPHPAAVFLKSYEEEEEETSLEVMKCETPKSLEEEVELETESESIAYILQDAALRTEFIEELRDAHEGLINSDGDKFSARAEHEEKLDLIDNAKIRLNAQLEALVRDFSLEEINKAIAYYHQTKHTKESKGQKIDRPAGWLTDCLRQRWWETAQSPEKTREQDEFEQWYAEAIASGIVEDVPINYLTKDYYGQPLVRVPKPGLFGAPYTLVHWRELWSALKEKGEFKTLKDKEFQQGE